MNILALETCFGACSVAAVRSTGSDQLHTTEEFERRQTGHAEALMPMIERVMGKAGMAFTSLDRIAVTTGPGSFTGMRIGISAARALSLATGAAVAGVPTLEVMASGARADFLQSYPERSLPHHLLVAVDARKDQVYVQCFSLSGRATAAAAVLSPEDAAKLVPAGTALLVGSGAGRVADQLTGRDAEIQCAFPDLQPRASCLAILAASGASGIDAVRPLYLRPPDAKPQDGKSISRLS